MRLSSKYRIFKKSNNNLKKFPLRILKFNRPKWKIIQKRLISWRSVRPKFFKHLQIARKSLYFYERIKRSHKVRLILKNNFYKTLDNSVNKSFFKKQLFIDKQKKTKKAFLSNFILPQFRIDILLCNLNLFLTSYQVRQSLNNKEIQVNGRCVSGNYFLKKFDIISIKKITPSTLIPFKTIFLNQSKNQYFSSFVEIDPYTKTLVVLKNFQQLGDEDLSLLVSEHIDVKKFRDYF